MINFSEFKEHTLTEEEKTGVKTLHGFDLDDTLFSQNHDKLRIHVNDHNGKRVQTLSNKEYGTHKLPKDHKYDFSEYSSSEAFTKSSKPIKKIISKLKAIHAAGGHAEIITARSDMDDQKKFAHHLKKHGIDIDKVHVSRCGNLKKNISEAKKEVIHELITKHGYNRVHLYDDLKDNLDAFLTLKAKHSGVEFIAHHVTHDPDTGEVSVTHRTV